MKNIIFSLVLCITSACAFAQTTYTGIVTNHSNSALKEVIIKAINEDISVITDASGYFKITLKMEPKVEISYMGFENQMVTLTRLENRIILNKDVNSLNEIVVSGNREKQKRNEVPAAISVISAEKIKEIKPIGIEDMVNDVPGVFMSTSKASSNEQHFMAVRSPISTKALFLYLEDGIPIRPTSVFNHNALLEMNTLAHERVEVLKGPNSSIYGSEAIGGSFNFILKKPTKNWSGSATAQMNTIGYKNFGVELSKTVYGVSGWYVAAQYSDRVDGPVDYSNYEKKAITVNNVNELTDKLTWTNSLNFVDYRGDMSGSINEENYLSESYGSTETFTEREAKSLRAKSSFEQKWNNYNKTTLNLIFRDNTMDQIPSYRINFLGTSGEINSNKFKSYAALAQHKIDFNFLNSSLVAGGAFDLSPQNYVANSITVTTNDNGIHTDYEINEDDYILDYEANIYNYAAFSQFEISPIEKVKITLGGRFDRFEYDFDQQIEGDDSLRADSKDSWNHFAPKIGFNYNVYEYAGIYGNFSNGFSPPQTSTLYRSDEETIDIKPSTYNNYEIGGYLNLNKKVKIDAAIYLLEGKNTLITIADENLDDVFISTNAGKTRSYGLEYGLTYIPVEGVTISHNGTASAHKYVRFVENGIDYSNTTRQTAPTIINTTRVNYKPNFIKGLNIGISYEKTGEYNTSFENQIVNENGSTTTATYKGHDIFNALASYKFKKIEVWAHALNIFDDLYANRVSYSYGSNRYTIGNPRTFQFGVKYSL